MRRFGKKLNCLVRSVTQDDDDNIVGMRLSSCHSLALLLDHHLQPYGFHPDFIL